jgi:hypothetical protein
MRAVLSHKNAGEGSMASFLKRVIKLGGKIAKPLLAATPAGQLALRAQQTLKSLGGNIKAAKLGKIQPLSVRAAVEKVAPAAPKKRLSVPKSLRTRRRASSGRRKGSRMPSDRITAAPKAKRLPPKGGLDLSAMAAQWRAAGKPGTWKDYTKNPANHIRKPK